jgi:hypothetical protein
MKISKWEMFLALSSQLTLVYNGTPVHLITIELEDGSGHCYNLTLRERNTGNTYKVFCRTTD